eukprot:CAMPEP_0117815948 /NCGR_PEP_ID=MMETSP0948-20121206/25107_1 /TAXON_ID=44440 /ORGANISM="Chattonella subsalsa, Strain CCMP2191" /LENGTH=121 /DNA_ID=CAMNT_0005653991 /DNA_START=31 /DNA_END=397 /DNA_ORIENTATION=+
MKDDAATADDSPEKQHTCKQMPKTLQCELDSMQSLVKGAARQNYGVPLEEVVDMMGNAVKTVVKISEWSFVEKSWAKPNKYNEYFAMRFLKINNGVRMSEYREGPNLAAFALSVGVNVQQK